MEYITNFEKAYDKLKINCDALMDTFQADKKFYIVALNLSGQRDILEDRAYKLIMEKGMLKALDASKP